MRMAPLGGRRTIPPGWKAVTLQEIKSNDPDACRAGPFGSSISRKFFVEAGVPVIRGNNLSTDLTDFIAENFVYVTEERAHTSYKSCLVRPGDLVFTCWGTIGQVGRIPEDGPFGEYVISNKQLKLRTDPHIANSRFVYYYVASKAGVEYLESRSIGAAVPGINLGILKSVPIAIPPMHQQEAIVAVLSAYDDLIENNRRRIQLLETAARLLYKEWFVHLRFPGHEHVKIIDDLPEGWVRKPLSEIAEFRLGKMLDQKKNRGDLKPYLANVNVRWGGFDLRDLREMRFESHETDKYGLKYGDIVMCEGGEPGRCAIWKEQIPGMMIQKALHRIRPKTDIDYRFLYHSLLHKAESGRLAMLFTGATIKHLPREKLAKVEVAVPLAGLASLFLEQVGPIEHQIAVLENGIARASEARDLLLPRLMNGEVAV